MRVSGGFWLALAAAAVIGPVKLLLALLLAAALHEGGHLALLRHYRVPVDSLALTAAGATLRADGTARLSYGQELLTVLAGPLVNLICAPLLALAGARLSWGTGFVLAGAHAVLGVYNLLPIRPLDGGRIVYLVFAFFFGPAVGDAAATVAGITASAALVVLGAHLTFALGGGYLFLLAALGLFLPQVRLAKRGGGV